MRYMVIEQFRSHDAAKQVYKRFREQGRMLSEGLHYLDSWIEPGFGRCFQLMECEDAKLFAEWTARWDDLVQFEIVSVVSSSEAATAITGSGLV